MDKSFHYKEANNATDINLHFKLILLIIVALTVVFVIAYLLLCFYIDVPTRMQEDCANMLKMLITFGFGTICGLFGGKSYNI